MARAAAKYSGPASKPFWQRVSRIRGEWAHDLAYIAACALQDHESRVLQLIEHAEAPLTKGTADKGPVEPTTGA